MTSSRVSFLSFPAYDVASQHYRHRSQKRSEMDRVKKAMCGALRHQSPNLGKS